MSLNAYGDRVGIDFNAPDVLNLSVIDYEPSGNATARAAALKCDDCGEEFKGVMAAARLAKHRKAHDLVQIETV